MCWERVWFNGSQHCLVVAICHLIIIVLNIVDIVRDLIVLEQVIEYHNLVFILIPFILQLLVIFYLVLGSIKDNYHYLIPWLVFTTPVLFLASFIACDFVAQGDLFQCFINFVFLGAMWLAWYQVFSRFRLLKQRADNYIFYTKVDS